MEKEVSADKKGLVEVVYYTDPLCCWSWAFEPQWRRLRYEFHGAMKWKYSMGGLIADWNSYNDTLHAVNRPMQMAPLWIQAKNLSGMPMNDSIWYKDPPYSSYPACVAFKCAELQSPVVAEKYLRRMREAVMLKGLNIARKEILLDLAITLEDETFSASLFEKHLAGDAGIETFRQDLQNCRYHNIQRYPTLTVSKPGGKGILITGYCPYKILLQALLKLEPELKTLQRTSVGLLDYQNFWGEVLPREEQELRQEKIHFQEDIML